MSVRPRHYIVMAILVAVLSTPACTPPGSVQPVGEKPVVQITSPETDTQFAPGDTVTVQVVAADSEGITRVELLAGDTPVAVRDLPQPAPTWQGELTWTAPDPGSYTLLVRVTNVAGATSDPAVFGVQVAGPGTPVARPSATPPPGAPTGVPTAVGPTAVGPTAVGPTVVGPTVVGPTAVGPTGVPTAVGPTALPTAVGPTAVGPTAVGPTAVGPTAVGPTAVGPTAVGPTAVGPTAPPTAVGPTAPPTPLPTTPPS